MSDRLQRIRERLEDVLEPEHLEIFDDSHLHTGHPGARSGMGHYTVAICSGHFRGTSSLERHRIVYKALGAMMQTDIHALRIDAWAPGER